MKKTEDGGPGTPEPTDDDTDYGEDYLLDTDD